MKLIVLLGTSAHRYNDMVVYAEAKYNPPLEASAAGAMSNVTRHDRFTVFNVPSTVLPAPHNFLHQAILLTL